MSIGSPLAGYGPHTFTSISGVELAAPTMTGGTIWVLNLSPPDPNAGTWTGTIGLSGKVDWPSGIDPNPPVGGLGDGMPVTTRIRYYNESAIDTGVQHLPPGDALPIV